MRLSILLAVMLVAAVATMGLRGMSAIHEGLATVYADRAAPLGQLSCILDATQHVRGSLVSATGESDTAPRELATLAEHDRAIGRLWAEHMATYLTP